MLAQLRLPFVQTPEPARHTLAVAGRTYDVRIARHRRARRYVLRLNPDETLRLTVPRGASIAGGLRFARRQADWILREHRRQAERSEPWRDGTRLWFRGEHVTLCVSRGRAVCATETISLADAGRDVRASVEAHFADLAKRELPPRGLELAGRLGLDIRQVAVRNQRSRWGACSPRRMITLNWRLVQMPASVSDYVILHELMHLRQPNHSRRFWREVESVCSWWREAERWLRRHGRDIL